MQSSNPLTLSEVMANSGYGTGAQHTPAVVMESVGFKEALRELGLTEELVTLALVEDIEDKKGKRVQELKLGAEILGMVKREEEPAKSNTTNYNFIFSADVQNDVKEIEARIKAKLLNHVPKT